MESIRLPYSYFTKEESCFLAIDAGCSLTKLAYVNKNDWNDGISNQKNKPDFVNVTLKVYDSSEDPMNIIQDVEKIIAKGSCINLCGTMLSKFLAPVEKFLNIRCVTISEFDSIGSAFAALKDEKDIFEHNDKDVIEDAQRHLIPMILALAPFGSYHLNNWDENSESKTIELPCMVATIGASCLYFKLDSEGEITPVDGSMFAGSTLLGLGSLLTGCKNFEELVQLAEAGSNKSLDIFSRELIYNSGDFQQDFMPPDWISYAFGKAKGCKIEDFSKEDLANTLVNSILMNITHTCHMCAQTNNLTRIYIVGGLCMSRLVRDTITRDIVLRCGLRKGKAKKIDVFFLKQAVYFQAIGNLLYNDCIENEANQTNNDAE
ncbi:DgyrCDS13982 [Dimorphilus gyrociliatus]|uniref:DgyrCDS13982 n=1 Tax=Dimorphilus gyrociliatus TaxID=2664684 RepID=A0A7I8WCH9_9ANNE|nr:DgyrCDS13982 [Dimorphilus gyrociliatus]